MRLKGCLSNYVGEVLVVYPQDRRIEGDDAPAYKAELDALIANAKHRKVLVNFENVDYMPTLVIGVLMTIAKQCRANEVVLKLCGLKEVSKQACALLQVNRLVELFDTEAEALSSFEKKKGWFG